MSASFSTSPELEQLKMILIFLSEVPYVDMADLPPSKDECYICKEPYDKTPWEPGGTLNHPVKLYCGHIVGLQCLTRWALSAYFDNACPLCRVDIVDMLRIPTVVQDLSFDCMMLEVLEVFKKRRSRTRKRKLLNIIKTRELLTEDREGEELLDEDRRMMLYEEMIGFMSKEQTLTRAPPIIQPVPAVRLLVHGAEGRREEERGGENEFLRIVTVVAIRDEVIASAFGRIMAFYGAKVWNAYHSDQSVLFNALVTILTGICAVAYARNIACGASGQFITSMGVSVLKQLLGISLLEFWKSK